MIQIDLITGFLGAGKTTFLREYVKYYMDRGIRVCILENDFGAVNVDMLLLNDLYEQGCGLEMLAGACDKDCHQRRLKTKLISMRMLGYQRVIVEPSGIYDTEEFFDVLREEPLDEWYKIDNVITLVDAGLKRDLSPESEYLLATQLCCAGSVVLGKTDLYSTERQAETVEYLNEILGRLNCKRKLDAGELVGKDYRDSFEQLSHCGYRTEVPGKVWFDTRGVFDSLYFMNMETTEEKLQKMVERLFEESDLGTVVRVKGFVKDASSGKYLQLNATKEELVLTGRETAQQVLIVIGEDLDRIKISEIMEKEADTL